MITGTGVVEAGDGATVLSIVATPGDDKIRLKLSNGQVQVTARTLSPEPQLFPLDGIDRVDIVGGAGADNIKVNKKISLPLLIDGGAGNDRMYAGRGNDLLIGGAGDDVLDAGDFGSFSVSTLDSNTLIGGAGNDTFVADRGNDSFVFTHESGAEDSIIGFDFENDIIDLSDPSFNGFYVYGSYFLTNDRRSYKSGSGTPGGVKPSNPFYVENGTGAWEIAARYSQLDLDDDLVEGGTLK